MSQRGRVTDYLQAMAEEIKIQAQQGQQAPPNPDMMKAQAAMLTAQARAEMVKVEQMKAQMPKGETKQGLDPMKAQLEMAKLQYKGELEKLRAHDKAITDTNLMRMKIQADQQRYREKNQSDVLKLKSKLSTKKP